jgi:DNA-binding winged helix-turn-helix (wHTH) protein
VTIGRYNGSTVNPRPLEPEPTEAFRVAGWLVQPSLNRLTRGDETVHLEPRAMQVLVCLVGSAGEMVPRTAMISAVWQTEYVTQNALTRAISHLRRAFADDARRPRVIETIARRGYRLMVPVEAVDVPARSAADVALACAIVVDGVQMVLAAGENVIGRASDVAILVAHTEVSRHHARIVVSAGGATVEDLDSKNGTFLWRERVTAPTRLEDGDEIAVGPSVLVFRVLSTMGTTQTARSEERD